MKFLAILMLCSVAAQQPDFERLAAQANAAREADRLDEAVGLYRKALELRPKWDEGWWYLATVLYERDRYDEAARAFGEAAQLQPQAGPVWSMLGLCEYRLGRYDQALANIQKGRALGVGDNPPLSRVLRYHEALLQLRNGEFETAQLYLDQLAYEGVKSEQMVLALGLSVLRRPALPEQVTAADRELFRRAGLAEYLLAQKNLGDAQPEYDRLAADFPKAPNVQYAHGRFHLATRNEGAAIAAFLREIENSPNHALARLQIAYVKLYLKDAAGGLPFAEEAVKLNPRLPLARYLLGRLLFETGHTARAIEELETARNIAPDEPKTFFALARAYARAGRRADADRARETFARLNKAAEEAAARGQGRADAIPERASPARPGPP